MTLWISVSNFKGLQDKMLNVMFLQFCQVRQGELYVER